MNDFEPFLLEKINKSELPHLIKKGRGGGDVFSYKEEFGKIMKATNDKLLEPLVVDGDGNLKPFVSIHFSSPFLKTWFRFVDEERLKAYEVPEQSHLAYEFFKDSYDSLPRVSNFAILDEVEKATLTIFSKNTSKTPKKDCAYDGPVLIISKNIWEESYALIKSEWFAEFLKSGFPGKSFPAYYKALSDRIGKLFGCLSVIYVNKRRKTINKYMTIFGDNAANMLTCMFLSTYFWTVNFYPNSGLQKFCIFTVPVSYKRTDSSLERLGTVSFCWPDSENCTLEEEDFYSLQSKANILIRTLLQVEQLEGNDTNWEVVSGEDIIRQSCHISKEVLGRINKIPKWLESIKKDIKDVKDEYFIKTFLEEQKFVAASPKIRALIEDIYFIVDGVKNNTRKENKIAILTFYSKPGTGKERLAQLAHYMSLKAHLPFPKFYPLLETDIKASLKGKSNIISLNDLENVFAIDGKAKTIGTKKRKKAGIENFLVKNCSAFENKEVLKKELMISGNIKGVQREIGDLVFAHLLCGSLFLDEFNTMDPKIANEFLRIFDKPHEVLIGNGQIIRLNNILIIIATNKTMDELMDEDFNPAIISRIDKNYREIPSLNERPEDVAVFVNKHFCELEQKEYGVKRIELNAMRLLCNSQWAENYRELQGCLDFIWNRRQQCRIKNAVLTFDEVLYAFQQRDMLIGGRNLNQPENKLVITAK